ncbi:MAG: hypothetical protein ABEK59_00115 [Halobacteria archaeon]
MTGFILIGKPLTAARQFATMDIEKPHLGLSDGSSGAIEVPKMKVEKVGTEEITIGAYFYVDNTMNEFGGHTDSIPYTVYMSGREEGEYTVVGSGEIDGVTVKPGKVVKEKTSFSIDTSKALKAVVITAAEAVGSQTVYIKIEGNAQLNFGPVTMKVPFHTSSKATINLSKAIE